MKCELKKAREYKIGFKNNLIFTGFEEGEIQWLGTDKDRKKAKTELEGEDAKEIEGSSNCCGAYVDYQYRNVGLCRACGEWCGVVADDEEEDDDLLGDKIRMEYQDNMRDDLEDYNK